LAFLFLTSLFLDLATRQWSAWLKTGKIPERLRIPCFSLMGAVFVYFTNWAFEYWFLLFRGGMGIPKWDPAAWHPLDRIFLQLVLGTLLCLGTPVNRKWHFIEPPPGGSLDSPTFTQREVVMVFCQVVGIALFLQHFSRLKGDLWSLRFLFRSPDAGHFHANTLAELGVTGLCVVVPVILLASARKWSSLMVAAEDRDPIRDRLLLLAGFGLLNLVNSGTSVVMDFLQAFFSVLFVPYGPRDFSSMRYLANTGMFCDVLTATMGYFLAFELPRIYRESVLARRTAVISAPSPGVAPQSPL